MIGSLLIATATCYECPAQMSRLAAGISWERSLMQQLEDLNLATGLGGVPFLSFSLAEVLFASSIQLA